MSTPSSVFRPAIVERQHAKGLDYFRNDLRRRCDELITPGTEAYIDWKERAKPFWRERMGCRQIPAALEDLAFGSVLFDAKYRDAARHILHTLADHQIAENMEGISPHGQPYRGWRHTVLDAGASSVALGIALDVLNPDLSSEERAKFGAYLLRNVEHLLANVPDPEEKKPEWNIGTTAMTGLALLALALRNAGVLDEERYTRAQELGLHRARLLLGRFVDAGGAFLEGPSYGCSAIEYIAAFAFARARLGDRELIEHPAWELAVRGLAHELIPHSGRPNLLNDAHDGFTLPWAALAAATKKNGLAQWVWQRIANFPEAPQLQAPGKEVWRTVTTRFYLYYDAAVKPVAPAEAGLPLRKHFPVRDLVDFRTGWGTDDALLSFVCDHSPRGGHRQADRGQVAFFALGEAFAIDSGYGSVKLPDGGSLRMGSVGGAHNLPLIHGEMQHEMPAAGGIRTLRLDAEIPTAEADIAASWRSLKSFTRRVAWLPGEAGEPPCAVVGDLAEWDLAGPMLLSWLLHTDASNKIEIDGRRVLLTGGRQGNHCLVQLVADSPGRWQEETYLDHPRLRYDWFAQPLQCLVLLAPFRAGEEMPSVESQAGPDGCALRVRRGNKAVTFLSATPGKTLEWGGVRTTEAFVTA